MKKLITYLLCATLTTGSIYAFTQKVLPGSERELADRAMTKAGRNAAVLNQSAETFVGERVLTKAQQQAINDLKAKPITHRKGSPVAVKPKMVLQSVRPYADSENAKITINVLMDWGDGSGYQILFDSDHSVYGLSLTPPYSIEPDTYAEYEYKLPANASGDLESGSWVNSGETQSIEIPAGTYDYAVVNPSMGSSGEVTIYIASGDVSSGDDFAFSAGAEYIFTLTQNGNYDLCTLDITAPVDLAVTGISSPTSGTGLSSETVSVTIANNGSEAISSFNVALSIDGGTAVEESVQQTIEPGATLDYTLTNKADLSAAGVHTVTVSAIADNDANPANNSFTKTVANGMPVEPPYTCDFETEEAFAEWMVIDNNGDNDSWEFNTGFYGSGVALIGYNVTDNLDDYLVTVNPVNLDAGENNITFEYRALSASYVESFEVLYGKTPDVEDMTVIRTVENFNENTVNVFCPITFNADEAGAYYFAFHATSIPDQMGMYIDNVTIDKGAYQGTPDIAVDRVILPTSATTLGSETIGAVVSNVGTDDITSFTLTYTVNDSPVGVSETFNTPIPMGESVTVEFLTTSDFSQEGTYTVTVTASNVVSQSGQEDSNADNNSVSGTTTHFAPADVPFTTDFTNEEDRGKWSCESGSWIYDTNYEALNALMGTPLISQGINLESGKSYRMTYNYMAGVVFLIWEVTEDFDILCGLDGTPIEEWETIASYEGVYTNDTFVTDDAIFECPESGVYSFAIVPRTNNASIYVKSASVTEMSDYDISISSVTGVPTLIPESQARNIKLNVNLENRGINAIEQGNIIITFNGTSSVAGMASIPQIAPGSTASVPVEVSATNSVAGETVTFNVIASLGASVVDPNQDDNEVALSVTLTEEELAYDHATADMYNDQYSVGAESTLGAGSVFSIGAEDVLTGISVGWGAVDGQMITLQVYKWDAATMTVGDLVLDTDVEQGTETGQITYTFAPRQLTPGDYLAVVYFMGYQLVCDLSNDGILYVVSGNVINTQVGLGYPAIRMIFGEGIAVAKDVAITDIPSPAIEGLFADNEPIVISVANNGYEAASATLNVTVNGNPLESQSIELSAYASSEYTFTADLSEPGEYTIAASVELEGDENTENNEMQKVVTSAEALDPYTMDFESCTDFAVSGFNPQWTSVDGDEAVVYGFQGITFPMPSTGAFGFMAFNPLATTPAMTDVAGIVPHGGNKFGAAFAASSGVNDDWLISPLLEMPQDGASVSFFVKSYTDQYGLEKYRVLVSETDDATTSFTEVESGEAPVEDWEEVSVDLSEYAGKKIYIAIQCVSEDAFIFMLDDIEVSKPEGQSVSDNLADATSITLYPNPASETLVINAAGATINEVALYSAAGTMVYSSTGINKADFRHNVSSYVPGIYFAKVVTDAGTKTMKFIVK